jgi:beta-N-acetylhexosaminidase
MLNKLIVSITFILCTAYCHAINPIINEMTTEEKVGQILMVFFKGETVNNEAKQLFEEAHVGSIIYYQWSNGLHSPQQVQNLSNGLQKLAREQKHKIPLLISTDQEGGAITRLNEWFTVFPNNEFIGSTNKSELAEAVAYAMGQEMKAVGINMNLAPVIDINSNPKYQVLKARSFGASPKKVTTFGKAALAGYKKANVLATLKHFPGYGEATTDPHQGLSVVLKPLIQLEQIELLPFKQLSQYADAIMTAHIVMPALDPKNCATLSNSIIEGKLRNEWKYQGLIVSDSLVMEGLLKQCEIIEEAAVKAFLAGHDILIFGGKLFCQKDTRDLTSNDIIKIHHYLVAAVKEGRIPQKRLDESVERILKIKQAYGLFEEVYPNASDIQKNVNTKEHRALAERLKSLN